jgi:AcrR family transcriptional regulator
MGVAGPCGPLGLRERKKARTREAIVDAALALFERKGFEATTIEDIAAAADVSPRTFFRYFESKVDLILAKNHEKNVGFGALLAQRPAHEAPVEAIRQVLRDQLANLLAEDAAAVRELQVVMSSPELRELAFDHFHGQQAELAVVIADRLGLPEGALPAQLLAGVVGTTMWAVVDRWVAGGADPASLADMVDEAFTLLGTGFDTCLRPLSADGPG